MLPTATGAPDASPTAARGKFITLFINATACYLLAYQAVNFVYQASCVFMARRANVPGVWSLSGIRFSLGDGGWYRDTVLNVYGLGPTLVFAMALASFILFWMWLRYQRGLLKLLLLWLVFHASNMVFGGLLADTVTQSNSWYVPNWLLSVGTWPSMVFGLLLGAVQVLLGFLAAIPFMLAQDSRTILQFDNRSKLVIYTIVGPWLVGSLLLAISKLPHLSLNELLHYATMGLLLIPLAQGCQQEFFNPDRGLPRPTSTAWGLVGLAVLALLAWRVALNTPIPFR